MNTSSTSRHSRLSSEDLDDISAANKEKATDKMTKWSVRVFKGIFGNNIGCTNVYQLAWINLKTKPKNAENRI